MVAVSVKTGPIAADDPARDVPREKWFNLMLARRTAVHICIPYDCRALLGYVREAEEHRMWEHTGHADLQEYIRKGLEVDPELLEWARIGLSAFEDGESVSLDQAVEAGKRAARVMRKSQALKSVGGANNPEGIGGKSGKRQQDCQVDNINLTKDDPKGGTSSTYLASRIKRDRPDIAERVEAGEFKSIRAAAIEAGIIKVPTAFEQVIRLLPKISDDEWEQIVAARATKGTA